VRGARELLLKGPLPRECSVIRYFERFFQGRAEIAIVTSLLEDSQQCCSFSGTFFIFSIPHSFGSITKYILRCYRPRFYIIAERAEKLRVSR
jgi:hypothetical protein